MPALSGYKVGDIQLYFEPVEHKYWRIDSQGNRVDIPSVTTILSVVDKSHSLVRWAVKLAVDTMRAGLLNDDGSFRALASEDLYLLLEDARTKHKQRLDDAGSVGHIAHACLEVTIQHAIDYTGGVVQEIQNYPTHPQAASCVDAALKWMRSHNVRWLATERKIYSKTFDVAGTTDGVCLVDSCDDPLCCRGWKFTNRKAISDWKSSNYLHPTYAAQVAVYEHAYEEETGDEVLDGWVLRLGKDDGQFESWYLPQEVFRMNLNFFASAHALHKALKAVQEQMSGNKAEVRALAKAQRHALKAEEKRREQEQRQAYRDAVKAARSEAKAMYKAFRAEKMSVSDAETKRDEWLEARLKAIDVEHGKVEAEPEPAPTAQPDYDPYAEFSVQ